MFTQTKGHSRRIVVMLVVLLMLLAMLPSTADARVNGFLTKPAGGAGTGGGVNEAFPRGFGIDLNGKEPGGLEWLSSQYDNYNWCAIYTGVTNGLEQAIDAVDSEGKAIPYYVNAYVDRNPGNISGSPENPEPFILLFKDGERVSLQGTVEVGEVTETKVGTPIRGSADRAGNTVDPSGQTGRWTVPMTLNFEPNHTYELAFAQGFICNNGVANMISEDGTGYYQRISTDPTDPERIYYEAHKYDESKYREYKYQTYKPSDKPGGKDVYLEDEYINPTEGTLHPMRFSLKTKPISVTGVTLDKASVALEQNETSQLTPTVKPELASDKSVTWTSSDETIATVDETGKITAKSPGKAKVTVTTVDGGFTASCDVLVKGIQINLEKKDLVVGDKIKLSADLFEEEIAGERAVGQKITWTVSNPKVASIEGEYLVAREAGTVTLTATSGDGRYTATVDLQIMNKPVPPTPTPEEPSAPGAVKPVDKDKTPATGDGSMAVSAMMLLVAAAATGIGAAKRAKVK